jgi:hypothetical protein
MDYILIMIKYWQACMVDLQISGGSTFSLLYDLNHISIDQLFVESRTGKYVVTEDIL